MISLYVIGFTALGLTTVWFVKDYWEFQDRPQSRDLLHLPDPMDNHYLFRRREDTLTRDDHDETKSVARRKSIPLLSQKGDVPRTSEYSKKENPEEESHGNRRRKFHYLIRKEPGPKVSDYLKPSVLTTPEKRWLSAVEHLKPVPQKIPIEDGPVVQVQLAPGGQWLAVCLPFRCDIYFSGSTVCVALHACEAS
jgi:hypothetical protein